ncbi:MAG TPA: BlaI/MecI/CopY family transcriptional regulator [Vicinamibacterales bacterium]|nr:BlaI/MecI/CopY family transcriptional regulator [Vicinamibacterales bacterium]
MPRRKRRRSDRLTPLELEIMEVLWAQGSATTQVVQKALGRRLAYTTVQTMLNVLCRKGKVRRSLRGRVYIHRPALSRRHELARTVREVIDRWFRGSATELVMTLLEDRHVAAETLAELQEHVTRFETHADGTD